jgi:hypothetical protein
MATATTAHLRELDGRMTDGVEVTLLWNRCDNSLIVSMSNTAHHRHLQFDAEPSTARDAFNHPYPYAVGKGLRAEEIFLAARPTSHHWRFSHDHVDARSVRASTQSAT